MYLGLQCEAKPKTLNLCALNDAANGGNLLRVHCTDYVMHLSSDHVNIRVPCIARFICLQHTASDLSDLNNYSNMSNSTMSTASIYTHSGGPIQAI